jgi:hypothetical protein
MWKSHPRRKKTGILMSRSADGRTSLLVDVKSNTTLPLDAVAAAVWERCDGEHPLAQIVDEIAAELPLHEPQRAVEEALEDLADAGMLSGVVPALRKQSRRLAIRTFAKVAAGLTLFASVPARGGSGGGGSGS